MKILPLLLLALVLGACGESGAQAQSTGGGGTSAPAPDVLVARAEPVATGDVAPSFDGLPSGGRTIVVFYRGPW